MADYDYDVLVIGSGPGGYVAAIRAAQLGLKTACVESRETLGGTCLNVGCIPSKASLHASELYEEAHSGTLAQFGVKLRGAGLDLGAMHAQRLDAVKGLTGGIEFLFKKNKIDWRKGHAAFTGPNAVEVGGKVVRAKNIVIATGSSVTPLPGVEIDQKIVMDSTGALDLLKVLEHLVVIGGKVIGLELGSVWRWLGAKVTVVEFLDQILPGFDGEVRKKCAKLFKKQGFEIRRSAKVTGVAVKSGKATVTVEPAKGGDAETIAADVVLMSIERRPNTDGLALDKAGVGLTEAAAKEHGKVSTGKFPMMANNRAKTNRDTDGFMKVIADAKSDCVLGVWIVSSLAGTMIAQAAQSMEFGATSEDIAYTCHAHPTHSEALKKAAIAVTDKPIHI